jgi:hypothetical protein
MRVPIRGFQRVKALLLGESIEICTSLCRLFPKSPYKTLLKRDEEFVKINCKEEIKVSFFFCKRAIMG